MPVIGFLGSGSSSAFAELLIAFRQGLTETGYVEGQNVSIESRWAEGEFGRLSDLAADLIQHQAAVIVTTGITSTLAAKAASSTIPLVFLSQDDPVKSGLVASFNRPGGNATGMSLLTEELVAKRLEFMRQVVPSAAPIAYLMNPHASDSEAQLGYMQTAARTVGQQFIILNASNERDIDMGFATLVQQGTGAIIVSTDPFLFSRRQQIVALAARYRVPAIYDRREFPAAGGLICYGTNLADAYRQIGVYTGRILKGTKPSDLPVMQPTKFELVINLKTAKALGLDVPPTLLALVDEVIE
jgi:putative tryptophan/tyrosine transport system substrate-binding protein